MSTFAYPFVGTFVRDDTAFLSYISKSFAVTPAGVSASATGTTLTFSTSLTGGQQTTLTALVAAYPDIITGTVDPVQLSTLNNSSTVLAANATYTGTWEDVSRYSTVLMTAFSDVSSSALGFTMQFGINSATADITRNFTVAAGTAFASTALLPARWMRLVYKNGTTAQTTFRLLARLSQDQAVPTADGLTPLDDTTSGPVSRALVDARTDVGSYAHLRADEEKRLRVRTQVDSAVLAPPGFAAAAQLNFLYSINPEVCNTVIATGGTVTQATGAAVLATSAAAASSASLSSRRFVSGRVVRVIVAPAFTVGVAGCTQICGIGNAENGLFVGYNGTAFGVLTRTSSVDTWTAATTFNNDKLNGSGPSAITLDPTKGNVYTITYDSSGFSNVSFALASTPAGSVPESIVFHRASFGNTATTLALRNISLPLLASVANSTNTSAISIRVAGMFAYTEAFNARVNGALRSFEVAKTVLSTAYVPLLSIANMSTYQTVTNCANLVLKQMSVSSDSTSKGNVLFAIFDNPALTDAAFADVNTTTTSARYDTSATSVTGGVQLCSFSTNRNGDRQIDLTAFDLVVSPGSSITIACRSSAPSASNSVAVSIAWTNDV